MAVLSATKSYSSGSVIQFNSVKTNYGSGFNSGNFRFTAPSEGLYVFTWSLALHSSYYGNTKLLKNGSVYHQVHCQSAYQQCGATVTVWLNKGDQVWLTAASSSVYLYATYTSFAGWKIN